MGLPGQWIAKSVKAGRPRSSKSVAVQNIFQDTVVEDAWKHRFPVGMFMDMGGQSLNTIRNPSGVGVTTINGNQWGAAGWSTILTHPDFGLVPTGLTDVFETNGQPYNHEQVQHIHQNTLDDARFHRVTYVAGCHGRWDSDTATGPDNFYWPDSFMPQSDSLADPFAAGDVSLYGSNPNVIGYALRDDVSMTHVNARTSAAAPMIRRIQENDVHGRPGVIVLVDMAASASLLSDDLKVVYCYLHPAGYYPNNTITPEGDLHGRTQSSPDVGGGGGDFVDGVRATMNAAPPGVRVYWQVQCHQTTSGGASRLRYPTGREINMMAAILAGEGAKGLFFFTLLDQAGNWDGLAHPNSADRLAGAVGFGRRFNEDIRRRLLNTARVTDAFVTVGGGKSFPSPAIFNYANAYKSTLYDAESKVYYTMIVNHDTSPAAITINLAGALTGKPGTLVNLETGASIATGGSVTLAGLDWALFRYQAN